MERVVLKHLTGSKSNQVEEFTVIQFPEITVGRDPGCTVKFDPDRDDLVGRQHAKIIANTEKRGEFKIVDLNSRNGTYVNRQRIFGEAAIVPGDVIQLGPGGPQLQFDVEPKPPTAVAPTRIAVDVTGNTSAQPISPTREDIASSFRDAGLSKPRVGKETVERLIAESNSRTRRNFILGGSALGAMGLVGGSLLYRRKSVMPPEVPAGVMTAAEIVKTYGQAVVFIKAAWKLIDLETGRQVYQLYLPIGSGKRGPRVVAGAKNIPIFTKRNGVLEPYLVDNDNDGNNRAIGGTLSASGFLVNQDGFILTNRHVASTWDTSYLWLSNEKFDAELFLKIDYDNGNKASFVNSGELPDRWVPSQSKTIFHGNPWNAETGWVQTRNSGKTLEGRHDFLRVTFPDTSTHFPARLARKSDRADVALIKIDIAEPQRTLKFDDKSEVKAGDPIVVLGYPAVSPNPVAIIRSRDQLKPSAEKNEVPSLTVSTGNIGKVMMDDTSRTAFSDIIINPLGDYYQLTVNSTGAGNSGGPVFDTRGKVIGIFCASMRMDVAITLAVPIKYGTELMHVDKAAGTQPPRV